VRKRKGVKHRKRRQQKRNTGDIGVPRDASKAEFGTGSGRDECSPRIKAGSRGSRTRPAREKKRRLHPVTGGGGTAQEVDQELLQEKTGPLGKTNQNGASLRVRKRNDKGEKKEGNDSGSGQKKGGNQTIRGGGNQRTWCNTWAGRGRTRGGTFNDDQKN